MQHRNSKDSGGARFSLEGKVAIVTGTSRGNGKVIADAYREAGARVYRLQRTLPGYVPKKDAPYYLKADVTDTDALRRAVARVWQREHRIDVLVNNAAVSRSHPSVTYPETDWDKTYETNLKAVFLLCQLVGPYMIRRHRGVILNITSIGAELGFPNNPAYVALKGGLKQLTKALANDWGKHQVRVNNLGLGYFRTDMTKPSWDDPIRRRERSQRTLLGRWGNAEDLVGPAVFLASDAARYMTGQDLYVDGGWLAKGL